MADVDHNLVTDRNHLEQLTTRAINDLVTLARHWLNEDQAACSPRATTSTGRTTARPDQTGTIATGPDRDDTETAPPVDHTKYADRDRLGRLIAGTARRLREEIHRRTPHTPEANCTCCELETATHGRNHHGTPTLCFDCNRYLRATGSHCTPEIHAKRPHIRWCSCPPACCDPCPDHAADGRSLSDRCRQRKNRGLWNRQATA